MSQWIKIVGGQLPPEGKAVNTKVDNDRVKDNEQFLVRKGYRFYFPDLSKYVSYTPTHWEKV